MIYTPGSRGPSSRIRRVVSDGWERCSSRLSPSSTRVTRVTASEIIPPVIIDAAPVAAPRASLNLVLFGFEACQPVLHGAQAPVHHGERVLHLRLELVKVLGIAGEIPEISDERERHYIPVPGGRRMRASNSSISRRSLGISASSRV